MTNQKILEKAIIKAVENGWEEGQEVILDDFKNNPAYYTSWDVVATIIFSHDFAKAFWGIKCIWIVGLEAYRIAWQYNLQQMVLEKEPLKYLERFL